MTQIFEYVCKEVLEETKRICDRCKKEETNVQLLQEWLRYSDTAGYFAKEYDDMDRLSLDLCEQCKKEVLGAYIQVDSFQYSE